MLIIISVLLLLCVFGTHHIRAVSFLALIFFQIQPYLWKGQHVFPCALFFQTVSGNKLTFHLSMWKRNYNTESSDTATTA